MACRRPYHCPTSQRLPQISRRRIVRDVDENSTKLLTKAKFGVEAQSMRGRRLGHEAANPLHMEIHGEGSSATVPVTGVPVVVTAICGRCRFEGCSVNR